jgi:hypothetical protein
MLRRARKRRLSRGVAIVGVLICGGCAVAPPTGPNVVAMPGKDKSFEAFQVDDAACRQYASAQIGYSSPGEAATQSAVTSATVGTVLGAALGAAIGAATGNPAAGAAIGAGSGLFVGGATGLNAASVSGSALQRRYDIAYVQCMGAKGENVPTLASTYAGYGYGYPAYPYPAYYPYYYYPYYPAFYGSAFFGFGFHGHGHHHH